MLVNAIAAFFRESVAGYFITHTDEPDKSRFLNCRLTKNSHHIG